MTTANNLWMFAPIGIHVSRTLQISHRIHPGNADVNRATRTVADLQWRSTVPFSTTTPRNSRLGRAFSAADEILRLTRCAGYEYRNALCRGAMDSVFS